jgi:micrococcal nuclease
VRSRLRAPALAVAAWLVAAPACDGQSQDSTAHGRAGSPRGPIRETRECVVARIVDGDTFTCRDGVRVRPIGLDAPELSQRPFGQAAQAALARMIPIGTRVRLERDVELLDRYERFLAYVWRDSVLVNWAMLRDGWAVLLTIPPNVQYVDDLREAQRLARESGAGLWAQQGFECLPADRRRGRC